MDIQDLVQTGKDMLNEVSDAVGKGSYEHLNDSLKEMTRRMYEQQARAARAREEQMEKLHGRDSQKAQEGTETQQQEWETGAVPESGRKEQTRQVFSETGRRKPPFLQKTVSRMSGILPQVFGFIGGIACVPVLIAALVLMSAFTGLFAGFLVLAIIMGAAEAGCIYAIVRGKRYRKLVRDYYRYGKTIGYREYIGLRELAGLLGEKPDAVHLRLNQMMHRGLLPQARYDKEETTLMLTPAVYEQYRHMESAWQQPDTPENRKQQETAADKESLQVKRILRDGEEYIAFIHKCNEEIPGEEMSEKLSRLENITRRIFSKVRRDPAAADSLQKFMDYYLPVTRKLLTAYVELEKQPAEGENIKETRQEIESAMDTINQAFETLLDSLFEDMAWDVSSDISVMRTMMAQDGLTHSGRVDYASESEGGNAS